MQKTLFIKLSIIAALCLIFAIGLAMIQSLVAERQRNADGVISEIAEQHVNAQSIITPFIVVSSTHTTSCNNRGSEPFATINTQTLKKTSPAVCNRQHSEQNLILPTQTQSRQQLTVSDDSYKRGIYHATSFQGKVHFEQSYKIDSSSLINTSSSTVANPVVTSTSASASNQSGQKSYQKTAYLLIPVSDLRGVTEMPTVTINGKTLTAEYPNTPLIQELTYLQVVLPPMRDSTLDIQIDIPLSGMSQVQTVPLGKQFMTSMQANWHAPNFVGQALPNQKSLSNDSFTASWQNQHLTVSNNQLLTQCISHSQEYCAIDNNTYVSHSDDYDRRTTYSSAARKGAGRMQMYTATNENNKEIQYQRISFNSFDVQFAEPNDVYRQTERSMKYALLLLAISFGSFFLFEVIKSLRIHPIQYLLVGMALLVFYVLLLSLAEQIAFWQAYAIAGTACAGLIGWYAYYVLHSVKRAGIFTLILSGQYAGFFTILTIEDLNLLIGAILCFVIVASVMFLTRKIDWYEVA